MIKHWEPQPFDNSNLPTLMSETKLSPLICQLLLQRGITSSADTKRFFDPKLSELHDPFLMRDMYVAVGRINQAIASQEPILIYGDYDVDGVCSVSMMYHFLQKHHQDLHFYIPDRYQEGYGISMEGIHFANEHEVKLIIAIDCGIRAVEQVAFAKKLDIEMIVCDHHLPGEQLPEAIAILNPKQANCDYPYKELCGCAVAFKLAQALSITNEWPTDNYLQLLDLVAIATSCDIVPLLDENRILVHQGVPLIEKANRTGISALLKISQRTKPISVSDIVFGLGPMINAAGRLGDAKEAVYLLLSQNEEEALEQALYLHQQNEERKLLNQEMARDAIVLLEKEDDSRKSIVLFQANWHKGIVGIVASRLVDKYHKPAIVLAESAGTAVGSARSISGFDINALIGKCSDLLTTYGGHKYAAGLTLPLENVTPFKERIEELLETEQLPEPAIKYALELPLKEINFEFYEALKKFAPFGPTNRNPVFLSTSVYLHSEPKVLKESHLKFQVTNDNTKETLSCIAFNQADALPLLQEREPFDVCYNLMENNWKGIRSLQLNIKAIRRSTS
ncbi:MAG: single-stranded-DNA-specific exonuclease RecJ [Saprospiraceae bacterium]